MENTLSKKSLGTQENNLVSLRFFYNYYYKKYKRTFDYDFYFSNYNISIFIHELDGFFYYLLGEQHLTDKTDIIALEHHHLSITKANKITYGNHIRCIGGFFRYLNFRYMNLKYQDVSPREAHEFYTVNREDLAERLKIFNNIEVAQNEPASRYKSITELQNIDLNNMLIPSTPSFTDIETGEYFEKVTNPVNPFKKGFLQYRNYFMHRLMYSYGLRVGEVLLVSLDSVGETLPDARGNTRFILIVQNLPDDMIDPRKRAPSIKTQHSYRHIELTEDDFILLSIYIEQYRTPLFEEKNIIDHGVMFIKDKGGLDPISYDGIRSIYRDKIDPTFAALHPYYRMKGKKNIDYMVTLTPHVGRHTWAYITLEFIYNEILEEDLMMSRDYGIRARMNGVLDTAVEKLRSLGGWSVNSKVPLKYASRFVEIVSNESNKKRTMQADREIATPERAIAKTNSNQLEDDGYDEEIPFDLFN
ncbi:site-specific integrase [Vibrio splendidus]|uniref:Site-specific integrase n=1 Tax=Vibrio splendidus TaxID=29497 RepID=A0AA43JZC4_VIBSP|nr:site-specific integrase [Vibrio splendidus]MDH5923671.1 site-specific integrase [Vibrio splendidus]